jgi:hypothetical protein
VRREHLCVARRELDRARELALGLGHAIGAQHHHAEQEVGVGVVRCQRDDLLHRRDRLHDLPRFEIGARSLREPRNVLCGMRAAEREREDEGEGGSSHVFVSPVPAPLVHE